MTVANDLADAPPHTFLSLPLADLGGDRIVLKIRDGVYAFYGHLMRGFITVKPGDIVKRGQVMAKVGNSGNTSESHLHFHLMTGPEPLTATNIPWELDRFAYGGEVEPETVCDLFGRRAHRRAAPMYSAVTFPATQ